MVCSALFPRVCIGVGWPLFGAAAPSPVSAKLMTRALWYHPRAMRLSDFDYILPRELIAQFPLERRADSRLLCLEGNSGALEDRLFRDLPELLDPGDLLVLNDTRVMAARLYGRKETGGRVEILIERVCAPRRALAQLRASKSPLAGARIQLSERYWVEVLGRQGDLFELHSVAVDFQWLMEELGHVPLPPYIERDDAEIDTARYQTVYGRRLGAVAAPTAGLHFDTAMLDRLRERGVGLTSVTLHVGAGTFQPVREEVLDRHVMHREMVSVGEEVCEQVHAARGEGGRIVAVGTTTVRALESAAAAGVLQAFQGETSLFIRPGFRFRVVDAMITNFHLPRSTLLMLVCAFAGYEQVMNAYAHAVHERYRFFSYGDAMLLARREPGESERT